jgi:hypothetical protein
VRKEKKIIRRFTQMKVGCYSQKKTKRHKNNCCHEGTKARRIKEEFSPPAADRRQKIRKKAKKKESCGGCSQVSGRKKYAIIFNRKKVPDIFSCARD